MKRAANPQIRHRNEKGDEGAVIYISGYSSPVGGITLASNENALTGLWFDGEKYFGDTLPEHYEKKDTPAIIEAKRWLDIYFTRKDPDFIPPLHMDQMTEFRRMVCEIMLEIPFGRTTTYGQIAKRIAAMRGIGRMSSQAVGGAVGHNPISIIIPCHRVVGTNGSLTGYAAGLDIKTALLKIEGTDMSGLFRPKKGTAL